MKTFIIIVTQLVPDEELDIFDQTVNPRGGHNFNALNEEEALKLFHAEIFISCPEHFKIEIKDLDTFTKELLAKLD